MQSLTLEGHPSTIAGLIAIVESLNKEQNFQYELLEATLTGVEKSTISISAPDAEHWYVLGGANSLFLKEMLKPVASKIAKLEAL
jgi:hypothetical protein